MPPARKNPGLQARLAQRSRAAPYPDTDQEAENDMVARWIQACPVDPSQQLVEQQGGFEVARGYLNGVDESFQDLTFIVPPNMSNPLAVPGRRTFEDDADAILRDLDYLENELEAPRVFATPPHAATHQQTFVDGHGVRGGSRAAPNFRPTKAVTTPFNANAGLPPSIANADLASLQTKIGFQQYGFEQSAQGIDASRQLRPHQGRRFVSQPPNTLASPNTFTIMPTATRQLGQGANINPNPSSTQVFGSEPASGQVQTSNATTTTSASTAGSATSSQSSTPFNTTASQQDNHGSNVNAAPTVKATFASNGLRRTINASLGRLMAGNNNYADDLMNRPPYGARPPAGVSLSPVEIMTFCPCWTYHPDVIIRLAKAGFNAYELATMQLDAIDDLNYDNMVKLRNRIQKHISISGKLICGLPDNKPWRSIHLDEVAVYNNLAGDTWRSRKLFDNNRPAVQWEDVKLVDIGGPIVKWPQGDDALLFTQCLQYALANPHVNYTTADCAKIIQEQGFLVPQTAGPFDHTYDERALKRFRASGPAIPDETAEAARKRKAQQKKSKAHARK